MLRNIISEREKELPVASIVKLLRIAEEEKSIISLSAGEPNFDAPKSIIKAAKKVLDAGETHYSPSSGLSEFKEAVIKKLRKENGITLKPENIIATVGSTEGLLLGLMCTIDPGEGVLLPDPGFLAYKPMVEVLNGMPISVPLMEEREFQFDVDVMDKRIIPEKTRVLILNTPSNPTGTVLTKRTLEEIADFAIDYNLLILSDEAYEKLVYDDVRHVSIGSLNGMKDYVVTLHSFSKTYAMPGFRIGYAAGPEKIIKAMTKVHIYTTLCSSTISQLTAVAALKGPQGCIEGMRKEYDRRRKLIIKRLNNIDGFECLDPKGAFYAFPNITKFKMKSFNFAEWLLKKAKVAVVPGTEFGRNGEGFIRLSYATEYKLIEKALDRIERVVKRLK